jgi:hypothetical protein
MELFLNLLWMLIAVGLLGAWRTRWVHQRHRAPRHSLQEWSALSIALVLLFFAVSMTDDMHSEIVALEDCSTSKRALVCSPGAHGLPQSGTALHTPFWVIAPSVGFFGPSSAMRKFDLAAQVRSSVLQSNHSSSRAPPVALV